MQLSTMMGMSFLLSCWSLKAFPFPPAARWMSEYHSEKSVRLTPCRWRVLRTRIQWRAAEAKQDRLSQNSLSHLPFSTKTRMSFFSWFSVSEAIPLTQTERSLRVIKTNPSQMQSLMMDWLSSCKRFRLIMSSAAPSFWGQMKRLDFCRTK